MRKKAEKKQKLPELQEKPFEMILSRDLQKFLKDIKQHLLDYYNMPIEDKDHKEDIQMHLIIQAIHTLPIAEQNLYLIKMFGEYNTVTLLADDLHITKQTIASHIRKTKIYITNYVNDHIESYTN